MSSVTGNLWSGRRALAPGAPLSCALPTSLLREGIQFPNLCEAFTEVRSECGDPPGVQEAWPCCPQAGARPGCGVAEAGSGKH